ncbi:unnamed protein product [Phyllotreta striolata]|uniref:Glucose-methanol-choline oxidoreductase N-terminal domain-containing protein n=1 Tax=Phyllotreta striolata TaxID=444603 RepID=A0A9N9XR87_PHYSR|nr:unnamed protein product [Phyllotreta striolata]
MMAGLRSVLFLIAAVLATGISAEFSPFDMVDEYVRQFKLGMNSLYKWSDAYKTKQYNFDKGEFNTTLALGAAEEYDFIIVGGGTAGLTLAHRLSEEPRWKILVLEAGGLETLITQVPAVQPQLLTTSYTWGYKTCPQKHACLGMEESKCCVIKGKALGGDSSINDLLYTRGHQRDYDIWADTGMKGWCWDNVLPYFKKMENACVKDMDRKYRHYGGPIHLENFEPTEPILAEKFLEAGKHCGLEKIDYNGKEHIGLAIPQVITKHGKRYSVAKAYLNPIVERNNLVILPYSHVTEILISHITKEANGVTYIKDDKLHIAKAKKEIILSAGAINTPQLLMLSGVGPHPILHKVGIDTISDLFVGFNLKDQVSFMGLNFLYEPHHHDEKTHEEENNEVRPPHEALDFRFDGPKFIPNLGLEDDDKVAHNFYNDGQQSQRIERDYKYEGEDAHEKIKWLHSHSDNEIIDYLKYGTGPLSSTGLQLVGFIKTEFSRDRTDYPDIQILLKKTHPKGGCYHFKGYSLKKELQNLLCKPQQGFQVEIVLLHPKSKGTMKLNDVDPYHHPYINPELLSDEDEFDVGTLMAGIKKVLKIVDSPSMKKLDVKLVHEKIPECDQAIFNDEYWKCAIKYLSVARGQITGTAKMGLPTEKEAVVDQDLKVYGVHKLRVADASVIPVSITGNLMAPEIMVAERAADILKECWSIKV